jgi:hypothetical protein
MAAKKFRPSFFRHFKKIDVVHSLLSLLLMFLLVTFESQAKCHWYQILIKLK